MLTMSASGKTGAVAISSAEMAAIPEAVYHLVERANVDRYVAAAAAIRQTSPALSVTGPFPAFAFAPEIL